MAKGKKARILAAILCASVMSGIYASPALAIDYFAYQSEKVTVAGTEIELNKPEIHHGNREWVVGHYDENWNWVAGHWKELDPVHPDGDTNCEHSATLITVGEINKLAQDSYNNALTVANALKEIQDDVDAFKDTDTHVKAGAATVEAATGDVTMQLVGKDGKPTEDTVTITGLASDDEVAKNITAAKEDITNAYTAEDKELEERVTNAYTAADTALEQKVTEAYTAADTKLKQELHNRIDSTKDTYIKYLENGKPVEYTVAADGTVALEVVSKDNKQDSEEISVGTVKIKDVASAKDLDIVEAKTQHISIDQEGNTIITSPNEKTTMTVTDEGVEVEGGYISAEEVRADKGYIGNAVINEKGVHVGDTEISTTDVIIQLGKEGEQINLSDVGLVKNLSDELKGEKPITTVVEAINKEAQIRGEEIDRIEHQVIGVTDGKTLKETYESKEYNGKPVQYIGDAQTLVDADVALDAAIQHETNERLDADAALNTRVDTVNERVGNLESRVDRLDDRIGKVGAMAAAIANLHTMGYDPAAPTEIAVGVGQYRSDTGMALGMFHYPNRDFMLSLSVSTAGDEFMGGIGATWKFGRKNPEKVAAIKQAQAEADMRRLESDKLAKAEALKQAAREAKIAAQQARHAKMAAEQAE